MLSLIRRCHIPLPRTRIQLIVSLLAICVAIHLLATQLSSTTWSSWNPSINTEEEEDPLQEVLRNTATRSPHLVHHISTFIDSGVNTTMQTMLVTDDFLNGTTTFGFIDDSLNETYVMSLQNVSLPDCPNTPPSLVGPIRVWLDAPPIEAIEKLYPDLEKGGHGQPRNCRANHKVALVIPYRDRDTHLRTLLHNLHSLLTKQQLDYSIFIVEQIPQQTFNRAKLMNVGYMEAIKMYPWDCFIFHDVDLLPEDDRNLYTCPTQPRHMSVAIDKFNYKLPYGSIFGGISALTTSQLKAINGFSNNYWGWGGEDDDLSARVLYAGFKISRYPNKIARYKMIKHVNEKSNPVNKCRFKLMKKTRLRWKKDGINSAEYKIEKLERLSLYTHILVDLLEDKSKAELERDGLASCKA